MPCPPPGNDLNPQTEPASLTSPAFTGGFFTISAIKKANTPERSLITEIIILSPSASESQRPSQGIFNEASTLY